MSIKELKRLKEEKLQFSVGGNVPSEEQIKARLADLNSKPVSNADKLAVFFGSAATVTGILACYGFLLRPMVIERWTDEFRTIDMCDWLVHWVPYVVVTILFLIAYDWLATYLRRFADERADLEPIAPTRCLSVLTACEATVEGQAYRKQVIAQNRQFVVAELHLLTQWANGAELRANCAKLYSLADQEA